MFQKIIIYILGFGVSLFVLCYVILPFFTKDTYEPPPLNASNNDQVLGTTTAQIPLPVVAHLSPPEVVKGIYMTSCVASSLSFRDKLVKIADETEVNTIMIDIKDFTGMLSFKTDDPELTDFLSTRCSVPDMKEFIQSLHEKNIYVVGRVTVFQDPFFTKKRPDLAVRRASDDSIWQDRKGIQYLDPGSEEVWDHVVRIAKVSHDIGFDEINFDYIRFPSDGNMQDINYPFSGIKYKPDVIESFFSYLHEKMTEEKIPISADLFGMTTTTYSDLNIGQVLEKALPYFDYVMPMVYPSHYPPNFNGWKDPNKVVYELVHYVMSSAVERTIASTTPVNTLDQERIGTSTPAVYTKPIWDKQKLRTWIQDFDYGGDYGPEEVRKEIQASYDSGLTSWFIWNPSNLYTVEALLKE
jgi:hypothetical protein